MKKKTIHKGIKTIHKGIKIHKGIRGVVCAEKSPLENGIYWILDLWKSLMVICITNVCKHLKLKKLKILTFWR